MPIREVLTFVCLGTPFCRRGTPDDRSMRWVVGRAFLRKHLGPGKRIQDKEMI